MPHAVTCTRTSSGPGIGRGRSASSNLLYSASKSAFMGLLLYLSVLFLQRCIAQKIVIAGGREMQVLQAAAVDKHRIEIPEVDGRHVIGQDFLHVGVKCLLLGSVGSGSRFG